MEQVNSILNAQSCQIIEIIEKDYYLISKSIASEKLLNAIKDEDHNKHKGNFNKKLKEINENQSNISISDASSEHNKKFNSLDSSISSITNLPYSSLVSKQSSGEKSNSYPF